MNNREAVNWLINISADIGKAEHSDLWHYEQALTEIMDMLESAQPEPHKGHWIWVAGELMCSKCRTIYSDLYPDYDNAVACPHCGAKMKGE